MALYEILYGRRYRFPVHWEEVEEKRILGPKIIARIVQVIDKIKDIIKSVQDRQTSYADLLRKAIEFEAGEKIFLKVAPIKGVLRFDNKEKLRPQFIGPFKILDRIGNVTYLLALSPRPSAIHNVFHMSILRKYAHDPKHVISYDSLEVQKDLTYKDVPLEIIEMKIHALWKKEIASIKVR
ncbi:uncharacterized protein LOC111406819 [Olea europaea var. sylvestris]|uniref:uncharacterized protein LOC111406819 n=1 Tax=Olea europaea var. sylvestris TaxID=158386 RepID=UPI000C1D7020|nr:uncharacterized protein LOC111406819 [Olea europaea var. sylvestris]